VIGAFTLPNLLDGNSNTSQGDPPNRQAVAGSSNRDGGGDNQRSQGGGGTGENTPPEPTTQTAAGQEETPAPSESENEPDQNGEQAPDESPEQAAEQTVDDFYTSAANGDYEKSSQLLTDAYRQSTWYSREKFSGTFDTLQSIRFTSGPNAQVDGNTATVSFSTIATHTNRVDRPDGTATLVRQGDEWKIDNLSVS
jgi:hypothetical protein